MKMEKDIKVRFMSNGGDCTFCGELSNDYPFASIMHINGGLNICERCIRERDPEQIDAMLEEAAVDDEKEAAHDKKKAAELEERAADEIKKDLVAYYANVDENENVFIRANPGRAKEIAATCKKTAVELEETAADLIKKDEIATWERDAADAIEFAGKLRSLKGQVKAFREGRPGADAA
jgi:hypothetical protein